MKTVTGKIEKGYPAVDFPEYNTYYQLSRPVRLASVKNAPSIVTDKVAFIARGKQVSYIPNDLYEYEEKIVINGTEHKSLCSICKRRLTKLLNKSACGDRRGPGPGCGSKFEATHNLESSPLEINYQQLAEDDRAIALLLQIPLWELMWIAKRSNKYYSEFTLTTNHGRKERKIAAPSASLKRVQRLLLDRLFVYHETLPCVKGFIKGHSIADNAAVHKGKGLVISLDIKDFFPTITIARIVGLFKKLGYSRKLALMIGRLTTYKETLPQGAPTSPMLSNMIAYRMDKVLTKIASSFQLSYTRYADDITFSGDSKSQSSIDSFIGIVKEIVAQQGFQINEEKTKVMRKGSRQTVTGLIVNKETNIRRDQYQQLRAIIHNCKTLGIESQAQLYFRKREALREDEQVTKKMICNFYATLKGKIAFIKVGNIARYRKLRAEFDGVTHP